MRAFSILSKNDAIDCLNLRGEEAEALYQYSEKVKREHVGNAVYLRGLIELSNRCSKDCLYCGIRSSNPHVNRYEVSEEECRQIIDLAIQEGLGSLVLQGGEKTNKNYVDFIERLVTYAREKSRGSLGITLSFGEQEMETLKRWKAAGASRYLIRIEASNRELYEKIHPRKGHSYDRRIRCLDVLKELDYQVGTGVMIGLPFQTVENLAEDLMFFKEREIDMVGMGPYLEHHETPLYQYRDITPSKEERFRLMLNMLACLRIMMPEINIASTTAMGTIAENGRELAIKIAANVIMPNLTPYKYRENYFLYENKICIFEEGADSKKNIEALVKRAGSEVVYHAQGNSQAYYNRLQKKTEKS